MGLALAMEEEAVTRYTRLAADMEKLGEPALAATFLALIEEERDHVSEITRWSSDLTGALPRAASRPWELPPEIARSWNEASASARLTPYRALSIAVHNEERGFAFYAYIAAHSDDEAVRSTAERLAAEELEHASVLRRERRRAYRRERRTPLLDLASVIAAASLEDFHRQSRRLEAAAAARHRWIAGRLEALAQREAAEVVARVAQSEGRQAAHDGGEGTLIGRDDPLAEGAAAATLLRARRLRHISARSRCWRASAWPIRPPRAGSGNDGASAGSLNRRQFDLSQGAEPRSYRYSAQEGRGWLRPLRTHPRSLAMRPAKLLLPIAVLAEFRAE